MSKWEEWKKAVGDSRPWHLLDPLKEIKDPEIVKKRFDICKSCEFYIKATTQCKKCGCLMIGKTKLSNAGCPIGKWHREDL